MFGGAPKCAKCAKSVYKTEEMLVDKVTLHKDCFRCTHCNGKLTLANFASVNATFYCKTHFKELFHTGGGKYSVFGDGNFKMKESGNVAEAAKGLAGAQPAKPALSELAPKPSKPAASKPAAASKPSKSASSSGASSGKSADRTRSASGSGSGAEKSAGGSKYKSLKERLRAYEKMASSGESNDEDEDEDRQQEQQQQKPVAAAKPGRRVSARAASLDAAAATSEAPTSPLAKSRKPLAVAAEDSADPPAPAAVAADPTPADRKAEEEDVVEEVKETVISKKKKDKKDKEPKAATRKTAESDAKTTTTKDSDIEAENARLKAKCEALQRDNEALKQLLAKTKGELALQTAKALEADEWCAKLSKDFEALQGKPAPALAALPE